jgi:dihydroorotate dehydrogenase electron transfer subunit
MRKKISQQKAKIISRKKLGKNYFAIGLAAGGIARSAAPGQFVQVKVADGDEPLLRRPLSIHEAGNGNIFLLYEELGPATKILSRRKTGDYLDIIGPLGSGFDCRLPIAERRRPVLAAGGMGLAPLLFLAEKLKPLKPLVLIGARTKAQILCEKEFQKFAGDVKIATDDGSRGLKGKVTELLQKILRENPGTRERITIYACGPRPMLREVAKIS